MQFVPYVKAALWQFVDKYGVSWADIIAVSGAAGAQFLGAKQEFPLMVGRCDANFENPEKVCGRNMVAHSPGLCLDIGSYGAWQCSDLAHVVKYSARTAGSSIPQHTMQQL